MRTSGIENHWNLFFSQRLKTLKNHLNLFFKKACVRRGTGGFHNKWEPPNTGYVSLSPPFSIYLEEVSSFMKNPPSVLCQIFGLI
jgi:hypothetical protein